MSRLASRTARGLLVALTFSLAGRLAASPQTNLLPPSERYPFARGTVERIDLGTRRINLRTSRGTRNFDVTARTYIFRGKEKIGLGELKAGTALKLSYYTNEVGQAFVKRIKVDQPEPTTGPDNSPAAVK